MNFSRFIVIRPCFIPDKNFKYTLARYPGKDEITGTIINIRKDYLIFYFIKAPKSQHSIY